MRAAPLAALLLALAVPARASSLRFGGYLKNLWQYGRALTDQRRFWQDQSRLTLQADGSYGWFVAHLDYRFEYVAGTYQQTADFKSFGFPLPSFWWNLEHEIAETEHTQLRQGVFRGWAGVETDRFTFRAGRQRIAWGTGKVWNPTDILNEFQPLSIESNERHGVDAFYARTPLGLLSQIEAVYAPHYDWARSGLMARVKGTVREVDVAVMGGKAPRENDAFIVGGEFAFYLFDGTLSGEAAYRDPGNPAPPNAPAILIPAGVNVAPRAVFWRASLGYDYRWGPDAALPVLLKDAWLRVEVYRNGNGETDPARYKFRELIEQEELFLGRHYAALLYEREVTPLWTAGFNAIVNADDESFYAAPSAKWNPWPDLYLTAAVQFYAGKAGTEYGTLGTTPFFIAQYYF